MAALSHPNVVKYFDSFLDEGKLNIVMEFCDGGDLQQYLKRHARDREFVPEETIWSIFLQIAAGLHYIHSQRVLHRDMKSANVFLCKVSSGLSLHCCTVAVSCSRLGVAVFLCGVCCW